MTENGQLIKVHSWLNDFLRNTYFSYVKLPGSRILDNLAEQNYIDFYSFQAALILGVSPNAPAKKIGESHKKIMILNHPDKGGSPYLASKINEAKDFLNK